MITLEIWSLYAWQKGKVLSFYINQFLKSGFNGNETLCDSSCIDDEVEVGYSSFCWYWIHSWIWICIKKKQIHNTGTNKEQKPVFLFSLCTIKFSKYYYILQNKARFSPGDPNSYSRPEMVKTNHIHLDLDVDFNKEILIGTCTLSMEKVHPKGNNTTRP